MSTARTGVTGYQPGVVVQPVNREKYKYEKLWTFPQYREEAPGARYASKFIELAKPRWGAEVIDFGCGTGRGAMELAKAGMKVTMLDFAKNCLDDHVRDALASSDTARFIQHDLENPVPMIAEYGYCTDVMEHIPEDKVDTVLTNVMMAAEKIFFVICSERCQYGPAYIGEETHVTIRPQEWWVERLTDRGFRIEWRESPKLCFEGGREVDFDAYLLVYGSAWGDVAEMSKHGEINTDVETVYRNIEVNAAKDWTEVRPYEEQDTEMMIVGGGPSLSDHEEDIRRMRAEGVKLVTLNGSYNWCIERGIIPSATVIVDARPFNKRFVEPVVDGCKYFVCSQCDPSVFDGLPKDRTYIWHDGADRTKEIMKRVGKEEYFPVVGGSTVLLRAIPLLRMLGYHRFHLIGCDSCLMPRAGASLFDPAPHHAFPQPENDGQIVTPVIVNGRVFYCHPWMAMQAREFLDLMRLMAEVIDMIVYGDGLLSHLVKTGAEMPVEEE